MEKLAEPQIEEKLKELPQWSELNGSIQRTYQFPDFMASIAFVNKMADHAESVDHHPDILIRYNKVTLTLSTHDAGGITENDFAFAAQADASA
ncbi:MAG: 4a-hydroxytetrahydrobiopterin dehydratase [Planctomycetota bacterium]